MTARLQQWPTAQPEKEPATHATETTFVQEAGHDHLGPRDPVWDGAELTVDGGPGMRRGGEAAERGRDRPSGRESPDTGVLGAPELHV